MKNVFFRFKENKFISIAIILELMLWTVLLGQVITLVLFDSIFIDKYKKSYPIENGITVNKIEGNIEEEVYKELEKSYKDKFFVSKREHISSDELDKLNITREKLKRAQKDGVYSLVKYNYNFVKYIAKDIEEKQWEVAEDHIPAILGKNFKGKVKIGDTIQLQDKNLKVIDILDKELFFKDKSDELFIGSEALDDSILIPIEKEYYIESKDSPSSLTLIVNGESLTESENIIKELYKIDNGVKSLGVQAELDDNISRLNKEKFLSVIQTSIIGILSILIIIITINYKIEENKEKIGIFLICGCTSKYIIKTFMKELGILLGIAVIFSIPLTYKIVRLANLVFYNEYRIEVIVIAVLITSVLLTSIICRHLLKIKKLTLRELMSEVRE